MSVNDFKPSAPSERFVPGPGPYLAKVVSLQDSTFMGILTVQLLRPVGNDPIPGQIRQVKYLAPFYGSTSSDFVSNNDDYGSTQKSYGMWMVPPDVGTIVLCIFVDGNPGKGYWLGCVPDESMNFSVPGLPATEYNNDGGTNALSGQNKRTPTAEYNKLTNTASSDPTLFNKPTHLIAAALDAQGLLADDTRGITTSGARREAPSMVFGISTPGPLDKQANAPTGAVGADGVSAIMPVSRLGGSAFVMDDGDDKFLRKTDASKGPPDYAAVEQKETDGDVTIPHNELLRLRTRTGHQILLHNSEDLIYIGNAKGTAWIELTSNGKIDIYAADSISVHTKADMNFYADRDINMEAGRNVNIRGDGKTQIESGANLNIVIAKDGYITTGGNLNLKTTGNHLETASKIYMNSSVAAGAAAKLSTFSNYYNADGGQIQSIMKRVPNVEPWPHHENLDPLAVTAAKTDRESSTPITFSNGKVQYPAFYQKYTTSVDTFSKYTTITPDDITGANNG